MRRVRRIAIAAAVAALAVPIGLVLLVLLTANTRPGRHAIEGVVGRLTPARIEGLSGRFPDRLRAAHLTVVDAQGPWLDAHDVAIDWTPTRLLRRWASIQSLSIRQLTVARLPIGDPAPSTAASAGPASLPVRVQVEALSIPVLRIDAPVTASVAVAGHVDLTSLTTGTGALTLGGIDRPGQYALSLVSDTRIAARLSVDEPAGGLLAAVAGLPAGAIQALATLDGPADAAALVADITAGPLAVHAAGTLNVPGQAVDGTVRATAPAMTVAGIGWDSAALDATVRGPWAAPGGTARLLVAAVRTAGGTVRRLSAEAAAPNPGQVSLDATLDGLALAAAPGLMDGAPVHVTATAELTGTRPVRFTLDHPLLRLAGEAQTAGPIIGSATLGLPSLGKLAAVAGVTLQGRADLTLKGTPDHATVDGLVAITSGAPYAALLGPAATIGLTVEQSDARILLPRLAIDGRAFHVDGSGQLAQGMLDATVRATLSALAAVAPGWTGAVTVDATAHGPTGAIGVQAQAQGTVGAPGQPAGPITATIDASGLPDAPAGQVRADGTLAGAPLHLQAALQRNGAATAITIDRAAWKSVRAAGTLQLTPARQGSAMIEFGSLGDLAALTSGPPASGRAEARLTLTPDAARVDATVQGLVAPSLSGGGLRVGRAELQGRVTGLDRPVLAATLTLDGVAAGRVGGRATIEANGPATNLAIHAAGQGQAAGGPASVDVRATVDAPGKIIRLSAAQATARGDTLRLLAPATVRLADGIVVDGLRLSARTAELEVAGRLGPALDLTARLRASGPAVALVPGLLGQGSVNLDAAITGAVAAPRGTVRLLATGLRAAAALAAPPLNVTGTAQLGGGTAQVDVRAQAGSATLNAAGRVPIGAGPLDVRVAGGIDLALLDPILGAQGRRVAGRVTLDGRVGGTLAVPMPAGTATLADASVEDFGQGVRISAINGTVRADGELARITGLTGRAGPGTIAIDGTAGLAGALPLDLVIRLRRARPLTSDRISADLDGDVSVRGPAAGPTVGGTITVRTAELRVPDSLPASIATLNARRPTDQPPPPAPAASPVALDLRIAVPGAVFVRGRGLDAELGGTLVLQGTAAAPTVNGGLLLRRGTLNAAGTVLTFTRGRVGFDGTGLSGKIDPTLDFVATSATSAITASINVGGYASAPKITFSSVPDLPQDEVLAYLLFKRSAQELGPLQLAQIAAAVAQLTGVGGGNDPLGRVQRGLGLDRLSVSGGTGATTGGTSRGPAIEGGRYVAPGVYVGAKQGLSGNQTAAQVQIDLLPGLKAQTEVGAGAGGSSVGLTYEFEY